MRFRITSFNRANSQRFSIQRYLFAIGLILLSTHFANAAYELVWQDEFTQADGSAPDPANWNYDVGGWGWGNNESQYYTTNLENARIENDQLVIELREDLANVYPENGYTSARLLTKDKHAWTYGRFEARIRLPFGGNGLWPAFWMLGNDIDSVGWPNCGEIDIMEYVSRIPYEIFGTIHGPGYAGGESFGNTYDFGAAIAPPRPPNLPDPYDPQYYHIYAVEWEPNQIRWYIDGMLYHQAEPQDISPDAWVFNHDHFIILNLAIGGNFGGTIDMANLTFPTQMLVDYVRVYRDTELTIPTLQAPGLIQAEAYTSQSGVRTEVCSDTGGGVNLSYLGDGDWVEYRLETPTAGRYKIDIRVASGALVSGRLVLSAEGNSITSPEITNTGGWQSWITVSAGEIDLPGGIFTLRADIESLDPNQDPFNMNWLDITLIEADPYADPDGDGFINLIEAAFGLDPYNPDPKSMMPAGKVVWVDGNAFMEIAYRRLIGGTGTTGVDYLANGYTYQVEASSSLETATWNSGTAFVEAVGTPVSNGDGTETVVVRTNSPVSSGGTFLRLTIRQSP